MYVDIVPVAQPVVVAIDLEAGEIAGTHVVESAAVTVTIPGTGGAENVIVNRLRNGLYFAPKQWTLPSAVLR